jgi:PTH1 family peptidyl-tRNA hydrolase
MTVELVVGLGNPGQDYESTRHNIGFRVVDELARRWGGARWVQRDASLIARPSGARPWLARPITYMNRSGLAGAELLALLHLEPERMLVICDDVDLLLGRLRIRRSGGAGTHNGLRDLVARVGSTFPRLRVGVGSEGECGDLADYVLSPFREEDLETVEEIVYRAADAVEAVLEDGFDAAMGAYNRAPEP